MAQFFILLILIGIASLIGQLGKKRKIGFGWSFALSFFLSPIIGLIITLCSKKNDIDFVDIKKED
jgi:uncharacterized membrane protein HdeD (DUF308 family)